MRIFKKPNLGNDWHCPICGTKAVEEVVLIGVQGTEDGGNIEAKQYHLSCIELTEVTMPDSKLIAMQYTPKGDDGFHIPNKVKTYVL